MKTWLGDNFENGSGGVFQTSLKKGVCFSNYFEKRVHFQTVFEKIPHPGARARVDRGQGPGPRPQPGGFKLSLKMDPVFQNSLKKYTLFQTFLKNMPRPIFKKLSRRHFFKVSPSHKGCKSLNVAILTFMLRCRTSSTSTSTRTTRSMLRKSGGRSNVPAAPNAYPGPSEAKPRMLKE